jgi:hypothetical protein
MAMRDHIFPPLQPIESKIAAMLDSPVQNAELWVAIAMAIYIAYCLWIHGRLMLLLPLAAYITCIVVFPAFFAPVQKDIAETYESVVFQPVPSPILVLQVWTYTYLSDQLMLVTLAVATFAAFILAYSIASYQGRLFSSEDKQIVVNFFVAVGFGFIVFFTVLPIWIARLIYGCIHDLPFYRALLPWRKG